ncbi:hypothetical protein [Natrialba asiatica]|uniref:Lipoprotein n=1 Tax=Natrialba asiatica (strain ATCC 700177 / DSM 12278 / JCM 9576 / FERM P-10747 / NBRC 102637 / 172P1) TaxID=29540 RepID=M0AZT8_NATA1|nr:hypothetical protein [Natrialba asiatica]ELZ04025.1 hypothetical protein C481_04626 [Natrialba asiatica DSM 12278]
MERRKILLGSGAALATVLAGCSSSETDEPNSDDGSSDDGGSGTGGNGSSDSDPDSDSDSDDVPGFDKDGFDLSSDKLSVMEINRSGGTVNILVSTQVTETEELYAEIESVAEDLATAIVDPDTFKDEIDTVEWVLEYEGSRVVGLYVDVQWVFDYLADEISREELADRIRASAD